MLPSGLSGFHSSSLWEQLLALFSEASLGSRALRGQGSDGLALRVHYHKELAAFKASLKEELWQKENGYWDNPPVRVLNDL